MAVTSLVALSLLLMTCTTAQEQFEQVFSCSGIRLVNGRVTPALPFYPDKSTVTIDCDAGYELMGKRSMACEEQLGGWDGMYPMCLRKEVKCENPGLANGIMSRRTTSGDTSEVETVEDTDPIHSNDVIMFECKAEFVLLVSEVVHEVGHVHSAICNEDGTWNGDLPTCQKAFSCSGIQLLNGKVTPAQPSYPDKSTVAIDCDEGYELIGQRIMTCDQDHGGWDSIYPTCIAETVTCGNLTFTSGHAMTEVVRNNISAMEVIKEGAVVYAGDLVRFQCNFGYVMRVGEEELSDGPMYSVLCQANGRWAEPLPVCKRFECGAPPTGNRLEVVGGTERAFYHTDQVQYRCSGEGYELLGPHTITCRMDMASWFPHRPTCRAMGCPSVRWPDNGLLISVNTSMKQGLCNEGFIRNGTELRACLTNGTWSGTPVRCTSEDQHCPDPGHPDGGFRSTDGFQAGSKLTYKCHNRFTLVGKAEQICMENRAWSGQPVKCLGPNEYSDPVYSVTHWRQIITNIERDNLHNGDHQVFMLFDSSGSISNDELNAERNFFGHLAFKLPHTKMTMASFNNTALLLADQTNSAGIGTALSNNVFTSGGATEIKRVLRFVRQSHAKQKSVVVILNDAINQGGSLSNVLNRRWRTDPKPNMYVITLGGFVDREDLLGAVSHHPDHHRHLFMLKHKADLHTLTLGIKDSPVVHGN